MTLTVKNDAKLFLLYLARLTVDLINTRYICFSILNFFASEKKKQPKN